MASKATPQSANAQRVEALKQTVEEVCLELASLGEESLFMSINLRQRSCFYLGSEPGKEFLGKRMDIIENFYHFINTSYPLTESESPTLKKDETADVTPLESGDATTSQDKVNLDFPDPQDDGSIEDDQNDPDFIPEKEKPSSLIIRRRGPGRPPISEDGSRTNIIEEMEKTIMGGTYSDENSQQNADDPNVTSIEKIVTNDYEYVKSLKHKHKAIYVCADCNSVCSWKRSMMTHLMTCKGKPDTEEAKQSMVSQELVTVPDLGSTQQHQVILSIVEEDDKGGTQTTTTKQVVIPKFSAMNDESLAEAVASIVDSQTEGTQPLGEVLKPQTSSDTESKARDQDFQQAVELIQSLQEGNSGAHDIEELAVKSVKDVKDEVSKTAEIATSPSKPNGEKMKDIPEKENEEDENNDKEDDMDVQEKETQNETKSLSRKEKEDDAPRKGENNVKQKGDKKRKDDSLDSEGEPEIISALTLKSIKSPNKAAPSTPLMSPTRSRRQVKANPKYADYETSPIVIKREISDEPAEESPSMSNRKTKPQSPGVSDVGEKKKETRGRKRKNMETEENDDKTDKKSDAATPLTSTSKRRKEKDVERSDEEAEEDMEDDTTAGDRTNSGNEGKRSSSRKDSPKTGQKTATETAQATPPKRGRGRPRKSEAKVYETVTPKDKKKEKTSENTETENGENGEEEEEEEDEEDKDEADKEEGIQPTSIKKDVGTTTPMNPLYFKRRRGRPRKSEVNDFVYFDPALKKEDKGLEEDWYPDDEDYSVPGTPTVKKSKRGRKKKNPLPLDPNRYRITSDDLQEAFRKGEEKGEFTCRECGETLNWKRSYMRHLEAHVQINEGKKTRFPCKVCNKVFVSEWEMKNHLRGKHKMLNVFDCDTCPRTFHTAVQFKNHKLQCTTENPNTDPIENDPEKPFTCNYCLMKFKSEQQLETHKELHNIVEYRCEECGKVFPEAYRLKNHVRDTHDKSDTYACDVCGKQFTSARYLHRHRICVHKRTESICRTCGKLFPTKSDLRLHIKIEHEEPDALTCPVCKEKFPSEKALDLHRPEHYNFQCETCGKKFQKLVKLRDHVRTHTNDYAFWCKDCNKGFTLESSLESHINNQHTDKVFMCNTCGCTFKNAQTLKNHMKVHTDAAEFNCKFCDSTYRTGEGLKNHMIENHMTEEQIRACNMQVWKCEYCDKVMGRKQHYERHRDQHLGVKKYKCPECSLGFFSQYHLNRHMKSHLSYPTGPKRIRRPNFKPSSTMTKSDQEDGDEIEELPEGTEIIIDNTMIQQDPGVDNVTETVYVTAMPEGQDEHGQQVQYAISQGDDQQMLEFVVINYPQENSTEVVGIASTEEENDVVQSILNLQEGITALPDATSVVVTESNDAPQ